MQFFKRILNFDEAEVAQHEKRLARRFPLFPDSPLASRLITADAKLSGRLLDLSSAGAGLLIPTESAALTAGQICQIELSIETLRLQLNARIARLHPHADGQSVGLDLKDNDYLARRNLVQLLEPIEIGSSLRSVDHKSVSHTEPGLLSVRYFSSTSSTLTIWRSVTDHSISGFEMRMHQYHVRNGASPPALKLFEDDSANASGGTGFGLPTLRPSIESGEEIRRLFNWVVPHLNDRLPADVRTYLQGFTHQGRT